MHAVGSNFDSFRWTHFQYFLSQLLVACDKAAPVTNCYPSCSASDCRNRCFKLPCSQWLLHWKIKEQMFTPGQRSTWAKGTRFHTHWPFKWVQCDTVHGSAVTCWKQSLWPPQLKPFSTPAVTCGCWDSAWITSLGGVLAIRGPEWICLDPGTKMANFSQGLLDHFWFWFIREIDGLQFYF